MEVVRKLRRNDVVVEIGRPGFMPARVWRRIDEYHVQIITVGQHVQIFRDEELELSDYKGRWHVPKFYGRKQQKRWLPMSSLKRLKYLAGAYNAHFGGYSLTGHKWTKKEKQEALADRQTEVNSWNDLVFLAPQPGPFLVMGTDTSSEPDQTHYSLAQKTPTCYSNRMIHIDNSASAMDNLIERLSEEVGEDVRGLPIILAEGSRKD